ncbi:MAG: Mut7-C RNAse domain-containing protein [Planctomycetota bacterium]
MNSTAKNLPLTIACDAMGGGLARWLRVLGVDTSYTPGIDDGTLVQQALAEDRIVISSDGKLFERRLFTTGELRGLRLPVGLRLRAQVLYVGQHLALPLGPPRCSLCNGKLLPVSRAEVSDVVPARSLVWVRDFFRCQACEHVFWQGTHWRRINTLRQELERLQI